MQKDTPPEDTNLGSKNYRTIFEIITLIIIALFLWKGVDVGLKNAMGTDEPLTVVVIDMSQWYVTSMTPTLTAGDILLMEGVKPETLKVGDVVTYTRGNRIIVHRIIEIVRENGEIKRIITKGDHNLMPDPPISPDQIKSRWTGIRIPIAGLAFLLANKPEGRTVVISLLIIVIIAFILEEVFKEKPYKL
ncbi:MAG TPA: signal peptidase I [Candidatus Bathyarchaeota archaeon]|nr:signal peptidase I [Candidatus Bathyarchaeota archaeon]